MVASAQRAEALERNQREAVPHCATTDPSARMPQQLHADGTIPVFAVGKLVGKVVVGYEVGNLVIFVGAG